MCHIFSRLCNICTSCTLAGVRCAMLARPKVLKEPITADMLKAMVEAAGPDPSLTEIRLLAVWFMRCDELVKLV